MGRMHLVAGVAALALAACAAAGAEVPYPSVTAPLQLHVEGTGSGGTVDLTVRVQVTGRLPAQPVLRVAVPAGAVLLQGLAEEDLGKLDAGARVERQFKVVASSGAIEVTVDAIGPSGGVHAEAAWPRPSLAPRATSDAVRPVPPTRIHGATIDRAIPVPRKAE